MSTRFPTLVVERAALGGQAAATMHLDNVPGFPEGVAGGELSQRLRRQAERFGVELLQAQQVEEIHSHENYHCMVSFIAPPLGSDRDDVA
ncbi:MAG: hypothetical protein WBH75_20210 [Thermoanaerobaculia bacterium]